MSLHLIFPFLLAGGAGVQPPPPQAAQPLPAQQKQPPQKQHAENYHQPFKGMPQKAADFKSIGPDGAASVKFEANGLRLTLPSGKVRPQPTGVATAFGMTGDFDISLDYEVLQEPTPAEAGDGLGTRISLTLNLNRAGNNEAAIRRKILAGHAPHLVVWRRLDTPADKPDDFNKTFPVKGKAGRFRLVRSGEDLSYFAAEGNATEFALLQTLVLGADDVKDIHISATTSSDKSAVDVRFTNLRVGAASLPRNLGPPKADVPTKNYAQSYDQSFKSSTQPEGWNFATRLSEQIVHFEAAGLRLTLGPKAPKGQTGGIGATFAVKGDFEISLAYQVLKEPDPVDALKGGTRFTLGITLDTPFLDTPKSETATLSRSVTSAGYVVWVRSRDRATPASHSFALPGANGRLTLVRAGEDLYYLAATAPDQPLVFLKKYRFRGEDVKRIAISSVIGGGDNAVFDVRVTDFRVRADGITGAPASSAPVAGGGPTVESPPSQQPRRSWLVPGLLAVLATGAVLTLAFLWRKRRGSGQGMEAGEGEPATVSFSCPKCAKGLSVRAAAAGKKVRCPKCGAAALVPAPGSDES